MKITRLELIKVKPRWMFLKLYTDTELYGLGEPVLEGHCTAVEAVVKEFEEYLIGKDPMMIEHHIQALYRGGFYRGGPLMLSAISGIEQALWDIKGKDLNVPVYQLLGGKVRDAIPVYVNGWFSPAKTPEEFAEKALEVRKNKYPGCKWDPFGKAW